MKSLFRKFVVYILVLEAKIILKRYKPQIIAITGNIGKTSTKDAIRSVLMEHTHVRASSKSFNSEFGVPLTILGEDTGWSSLSLWVLIMLRGLSKCIFKQDYPKVLVLEVGADRKGDIKKITKWLKPDITVVTQFQKVPVHIENYSSREELIKEKGYLVKATKKSGLVIFTSDDHDSHELSKFAKSKTASFGFENWSDIKVESLDTLYESYGDLETPIGLSARITMGDSSVPMRMMGIVGGGMVYAALPALYIGTLFGINLVNGVQSLVLFDSPKGRMKLLRGVKKSTVIDDTYNASPKAVSHALKTLKGLHTDGKKIAVLGDMLELGDGSKQSHFEIGQEVAQTVHILVTVGKKSRDIVDGAMSSGMKDDYIYQFDNSVEAGVFTEKLIAQNDIILVKGSQGMRMEKAVEEIMAEVDRKEELLARQDAEWKNR